MARGYADQLFRSFGQAANFYSATYNFTAVNAATDIFTILGSASKKVTVWHISVSGTQTTQSNELFSLIKRSTANTGGTGTAVTLVPMDSQYPAPTASVTAYTANPTLGTAVGTIQTDWVFVPDTSAPKATDSNGFVTLDGIPVALLNGVSESLCINLNARTLAGNSLCCHVIWSEI